MKFNYEVNDFVRDSGKQTVLVLEIDEPAGIVNIMRPGGATLWVRGETLSLEKSEVSKASELIRG